MICQVSSNGRRPLPRYFILFSDMLIYCIIRAGKTPSQPGALKCSCILPLKRCVVQPVLSQGVLRLSCHGETLILFSACVDDTKKWLEALQQALKQVLPFLFVLPQYCCFLQYFNLISFNFPVPR